MTRRKVAPGPTPEQLAVASSRYKHRRADELYHEARALELATDAAELAADKACRARPFPIPLDAHVRAFVGSLRRAAAALVPPASWALREEALAVPLSSTVDPVEVDPFDGGPLVLVTA